MKFHMVPIDYNASVYAFGPNTVYSRERWSGLWSGTEGIEFHLINECILVPVQVLEFFYRVHTKEVLN